VIEYLIHHTEAALLAALLLLFQSLPKILIWETLPSVE